jgi:hypothetical protein
MAVPPGGAHRPSACTHRCSVVPSLQCNTYADFLHEKTMLQWYALERGHSVIYGARFHCECAVIELVWAFIANALRTDMDGTPATLVSALVNELAFECKPDVVGRLFYRPALYVFLYSLGVCCDSRLAAGLAASDVFELMRAFTGSGNKSGTTAAHATASAAGTEASAAGFNTEAYDEADPVALGDDFVGARPLIAAPAPAAAPAAATAAAAPVAGGFPSTPLPEEVPGNLWELMSCIMDPERRAEVPDKRRKTGTAFAEFSEVVKRAWNARSSSREVLRLLENKTRAEMTPPFAVRHSVVLFLGVPSGLPCIQRPGDAVAVAGAAGGAAGGGAARSN